MPFICSDALITYSFIDQAVPGSVLMHLSWLKCAVRIFPTLEMTGESHSSGVVLPSPEIGCSRDDNVHAAEVPMFVLVDSKCGLLPVLDG